MGVCGGGGREGGGERERGREREREREGERGREREGERERENGTADGAAVLPYPRQTQADNSHDDVIRPVLNGRKLYRRITIRMQRQSQG